MKKTAFYISIFFIAISLFMPFSNLANACGGAGDPCPVTPVKKVVSSVYNLLAPIGTLTQFSSNNIGDYFNIIFKLAIGLCGALAVVMIIISSIQYMGDESVFGKTEAKSKIISAILGLLIALGSYALLNTINPALLGKSGVNVTPTIVK